MLPIAVTLIVVMWLLYRSGKAAVGEGDASLQEIVGSADSSMALMYGALVGIATITLLCRGQRLLNHHQIIHAAVAGMKIVLPAIAILWFASALSRMTGTKSVDGAATTTSYEFKDHRLYTADYLAEQVLPDADSPDADSPEADSPGEAAGLTTTIRLLPTVVFLLAAILAFATGTSFGTMGILMPMAVTLTYSLLKSQSAAVDPNDPILLASIASVLSGAVFGDHCSPISDTTILSSQSAAVDHMAHVLTQLPYALLVGGVSVMLGTLPLGWGVSLWILLPLQLIALAVVLRIFGRRV